MSHHFIGPKLPLVSSDSIAEPAQKTSLSIVPNKSPDILKKNLGQTKNLNEFTKNKLEKNNIISALQISSKAHEFSTEAINEQTTNRLSFTKNQIQQKIKENLSFEDNGFGKAVINYKTGAIIALKELAVSCKNYSQEEIIEVIKDVIVKEVESYQNSSQQEFGALSLNFAISKDSNVLPKGLQRLVLATLNAISENP